jgi:hypothetical protein
LAKKPLRRPDWPAGERREFFLYLQRLVLQGGDLPVAEIGRAIGFSHQTVHKALTGPKMPSWRVVAAIVAGVASPAEIAEARERYERAVGDQRNLASGEVSLNPRQTTGASARHELMRLLNNARADSPYKVEYLGSQAGMGRSKAYTVFAGTSLPTKTQLSRLAEILELSPQRARTAESYRDQAAREQREQGRHRGRDYQAR